MANDININESTILEALNAKIDYDGGNYKGSGLADYVVDKSGDIMTGALTFHRTGTQILIQTDEFDQGVAVDSNRYCGIQFNDKNGSRFGKIEGHYLTDGTVKFGLNACRNVNGTNYYAQILTWVDAQGGLHCDFPKCTTKATTTSSATSDKVAVVVKNYVSGTSWYRVWSDGWVEQGGKYNHGSLTYDFSTTITLPIKMANDTYTAVATASRNNASAANRAGVTNIFQQTTTQLGLGWYRGNNTSETMQYINWQVSGYKA